MKIIDRNGRLFGKISVIDLLVIAVVVVLAAALYVKNNRTTTGTSVAEQKITFQVRVRGVDDYIADAILVDDYLYDENYSSSGSLGRITDIQVEKEPGAKLCATLTDGTAGLLEVENSKDLLITVEGSGLVNGKSYVINRVYDLGVNSARTYRTNKAVFTGMVASISTES